MPSPATHRRTVPRRRIAVLAAAVALGVAARAAAELPPGFVYADALVPGLRVDLRYHGSDNFVGHPIPGYEAARVVLTRPAAEALRAVQEDLAPFGLGLLVYDAYRPTRAVAAFVRWAEDPTAVATKARYYPDVAKADLLPRGYIAAHSSHSRGSTVDLTVVTRDGAALDMGTHFDFFSPRSWPESADVPAAARANRLLLRTLMTRHGFVPYAQEWWHFTLADEPFPETEFDFPIR